MAHYQLTPAYGRDYKNKTDVRSDFEADKDFIDASFDATGTYVNRPQIPAGAMVEIRYDRLQKAIVFEAGTKPPRPHLTKSTPREFVRYHVKFRREAYPDSEDQSDIESRIGVGFGSKVKAIREAKKFAKFPHTVRTVVYGERKSGSRCALAEFRGPITPRA